MEVKIDTNNIFHRLYSALKAKGTIVDDIAGRNKLITSVFEFTKSTINKYDYTNVWFCVDSDEVWRSEAYDIYKGNRKTDNSFINSCIDEFCIRLTAKVGNCIIRINGYESDDVIACTTRLSLKKNVSSIIISSDSDLNQLIHFTGFDNPFIIQYDPDANKRCHYIPSELSDCGPAEGTNDIFSDDYIYPAIYEILKDSSKTINRHKKTIIKILSGDSGDNILSCYKNINGKNTSFGEKRAEYVYEFYPDLVMYYGDNLREIASKIINITKSGELNRIDEIVENLNLNRKLIVLDEDNIQNYHELESLCDTFLNHPPQSSNLRNVQI